MEKYENVCGSASWILIITMSVMIIMTTMMIIKSMKGRVLFLGGIIQVGIRTSNYLNDKDTLASLYYDNDNDGVSIASQESLDY